MRLFKIECEWEMLEACGVFKTREKAEEAIKDAILGIIHRELTDTVRLDKQIRIRERIFEMLSEEGNLIMPQIVTTKNLIE